MSYKHADVWFKGPPARHKCDILFHCGRVVTNLLDALLNMYIGRLHVRETFSRLAKIVRRVDDGVRINV